MSLNTQRHYVGKRITGVWNHGNVSDAVNNLLQIQKSYTITERLPSGVVVGTVMTTGIDIRDRCNYLLGKITHIYEITDANKQLVLSYVPGGNAAKQRLH